MQPRYSFVTHWQLKAPLQEVWDALYNSMECPQWWRGVYSVTEIQKNNAEGINGKRKYTWKSFLPYSLSFTLQLTEIEPLKRLKGIASGELEGTGEWFFSERNGIVHVQYNWDVVTHKKWMNKFSFLLRPIFSFNHNVVMHWGGKGTGKKARHNILKRITTLPVVFGTIIAR